MKEKIRSYFAILNTAEEVCKCIESKQKQPVSIVFNNLTKKYVVFFVEDSENYR